MSLGCWEKEHIMVKYRGVDITDRMGFCVCSECTKEVRAWVDSMLDKKGAEPTEAERLKAEIAVLASELQCIDVCKCNAGNCEDIIKRMWKLSS